MFASYYVIFYCPWYFSKAEKLSKNYKTLGASRLVPKIAIIMIRKQNIIVFGVSEDRDSSIWCQEVEFILGYVGYTVNELKSPICFVWVVSAPAKNILCL